MALCVFPMGKLIESALPRIWPAFLWAIKPVLSALVAMKPEACSAFCVGCILGEGSIDPHSWLVVWVRGS